MKKVYRPPELIEYGRIDQLTLGATGPQADLVYSGGTFQNNNNGPGCVNNVSSSACVVFR